MKLALTGLVLAASLSAQITVHEWGTFTTAGLRPDLLPCFVNQLPATVARAATHIEASRLTFYAPQPSTVDVRIEFPQGLHTAWYPSATGTFADRGLYRIMTDPPGYIEWKGLEVLPGQALPFHPGELRGHAAFPSPETVAHYFSARLTDAAPVRITDRWHRTEQEKMLFYSGQGTRELALRMLRRADGRIELRNTGEQPIPLAIVIGNRDGRLRYRVVRALRGTVIVDAPELSATAAELRALLQQELQAMGLFQKEATALLTAWPDTWLAPGTRALYIAPRGEIDRLLPLTIAPTPDSVVRVFVGRLDTNVAPSAAGGFVGRPSILPTASCGPIPNKEKNQ